MRVAFVLVLLLFVPLLLAAPPMYPGGTRGVGGARRGTRSDATMPHPAQPPSQRINWLSPTNPFAAELSTMPPLGSAWVDRRRGKPRNRVTVVPDAGQSPMTAQAPAPNTAPVPDVDSRGSILRRQYNLSTSPLTLTVPQSSNSILYAASLNPLL